MCLALKARGAGLVQVQVWIGVDTRSVAPKEWWGDQRVDVPREALWIPSYSKGSEVQVLDRTIAPLHTMGKVVSIHSEDGETRLLVQLEDRPEAVELGEHQIIKRSQILA